MTARTRKRLMSRDRFIGPKTREASASETCLSAFHLAKGRFLVCFLEAGGPFGFDKSLPQQACSPLEAAKALCAAALKACAPSAHRGCVDQSFDPVVRLPPRGNLTPVVTREENGRADPEAMAQRPAARARLSRQ